ncbi:MAG: hypothetical protein ACKO7W_06265 [Elainella sp.]
MRTSQSKVKNFEGYRLDPLDSIRLRLVAKQRGLKPATVVRQLVEKYLDSFEVGKGQP